MRLPPVDVQFKSITSPSLYTPAMAPLVSIRLSPLCICGVFGGTEKYYGPWTNEYSFETFKSQFRELKIWYHNDLLRIETYIEICVDVKTCWNPAKCPFETLYDITA